MRVLLPLPATMMVSALSGGRHILSLRDRALLKCAGPSHTAAPVPPRRARRSRARVLLLPAGRYRRRAWHDGTVSGFGRVLRDLGRAHGIERTDLAFAVTLEEPREGSRTGHLPHQRPRADAPRSPNAMKARRRRAAQRGEIGEREAASPRCSVMNRRNWVTSRR